MAYTLTHLPAPDTHAWSIGAGVSATPAGGAPLVVGTACGYVDNGGLRVFTAGGLGATRWRPGASWAAEASIVDVRALAAYFDCNDDGDAVGVYVDDGTNGLIVDKAGALHAHPALRDVMLLAVGARAPTKNGNNPPVAFYAAGERSYGPRGGRALVRARVTFQSGAATVSVETLPPLFGAEVTTPGAVNAQGWIVGTAWTSGPNDGPYTRHEPFVLLPGSTQPTPLPIGGTGIAAAEGITDAADGKAWIVGWRYTGGKFQAVAWRVALDAGGALVAEPPVPIPVPAGEHSRLYAVAGTSAEFRAVGTVTNDVYWWDGLRAFLFDRTTSTPLDTLVPAAGWRFEMPLAISKDGAIVGRGHQGSVEYGFLLRPSSAGTTAPTAPSAGPGGGGAPRAARAWTRRLRGLQGRPGAPIPLPTDDGLAVLPPLPVVETEEALDAYEAALDPKTRKSLARLTEDVPRGKGRRGRA